MKRLGCLMLVCLLCLRAACARAGLYEVCESYGTEEERQYVMEELIPQIVRERVQPGMTERQKVLALHQWICGNAYYDNTYSHHSGFCIFLHRTGVCDAYTAAFHWLLEAAGIESLEIGGEARGDGHTWNLVRVDGQWYHVDVTWDDTSTDNQRYFLVSDAFMKQKSHVWGSDIKADTNQVGWVSLGEETYYYGDDGRRAVGYRQIDGCTYYFDAEGVGRAGWRVIDGEDYYFWPQVISGGPYWLEKDGVEQAFYFDANGKALGHIHTPQTTPGRAPTETSPGYTKSSRCAECGETLIARREIPALGDMDVLRLPAGIQSIQASAFAGAACQAVLIPEGCRAIESRAFADCARLLYVLLPASLTDIAPDAFAGSDPMLRRE